MRPILALTLLLALLPSPVGAQAGCRFVLGFASAADLLGSPTVGECIEDQRTLTGPERTVVGEMPVQLSTGTSVQRTTTGLFVWTPSTNRTLFINGDGYWSGTSRSLSYTSWADYAQREAAQAASPAATPPPPAAPGPPAAPISARSRCSGLAAELASEMGPPSSGSVRDLTRSLTAIWEDETSDPVEATLLDLCREAAGSYGSRGVDCFDRAMKVAVGRERLFPGQGFAAYQGAYDRCIAGR